MKETMPQDIEVRYILPAIRKELARVFVQRHNLSQKNAAKLLGLTEAAVSQYQHSKRAKEVSFSGKIIDEVCASAKMILAGKKNKNLVIAEMYRLSNLASVRSVLCGVHKSKSKGLGSCNICFRR